MRTNEDMNGGGGGTSRRRGRVNVRVREIGTRASGSQEKPRFACAKSQQKPRWMRAESQEKPRWTVVKSQGKPTKAKESQGFARIRMLTGFVSGRF
jgi:hypothetical protein